MSGNDPLEPRKHTSASAPPADINGIRFGGWRSRSATGKLKDIDGMALGILTGLLRGRLVPRKGLTALTTKRGPKGFYKGKGCKSTGRHTSKGGYVLMAEKLPVYVVPDLTDFKLKAYVAHDTPKVPQLETTVSSVGDASPAT